MLTVAMRYLFPKISLRHFLWMLVFGAVGAVVAGAYGVVHDQVTFTISPEYFTRFKFLQFHYLDTAQSVRWVVGQIGFLATRWVGFFAEWFMGRVAIPRVGPHRAAGLCLRAVGMMLGLAAGAGCIGWLWAPKDESDPRLLAWGTALQGWQVDDLLAFVQVGHIHNAGYSGALAGLILALVWLWKRGCVMPGPNAGVC